MSRGLRDELRDGDREVWGPAVDEGAVSLTGGVRLGRGLAGTWS